MRGGGAIGAGGTRRPLRRRVRPGARGWALALAVLGAGCGGAGALGPASEPAMARGEAAGDRLAHRPGLADPAEVAQREAAGQPRASRAGEVVLEPPTLHSLGVRWPVRGDANANAEVRVDYRRAGAVAWRPALSLFRVHPFRQPEAARVPMGWLFAGSVLDLVPDTEYEVRLSLVDPDGDATERVVTQRTLAEPVAPEGLRTRHVVPGAGGGSGSAADPFRGLAAAQATAAPGDLFLLHAGVYAGRWRVERRGRPGRPIVWRAAGDGAAVLDGLAGDALVDAQGAAWVWLEGLSLRNASRLVVASGAQHLVVRRSAFEVTRDGIVAREGPGGGSRGFVLTDNVFRGPGTWPRRGLEGINGITLTGTGHVVAHNRFTGLADGVHGAEQGRLSASDIHHNDVEMCTDDGLETDYSETNVRVFRNRITNCFAGVSFQPVFGGPVYAFRNAIYNVQYSPFKLHNDTSGIVLLHNTSLRYAIAFSIEPAGDVVADVVTRNNFFLGGGTEALVSSGKMQRCDFDADGYGWPVRSFARWNRRAYRTPGEARAELYRVHGVRVLGPGGHFASGAAVPTDFRLRVPPAANDLRLRPGSGAVDEGVVLPNVSDGYAGRAPDLGCCEVGAPLPAYGPR